MKITTMITLPEEVYEYYKNAAALLGNITTEQLIVNTLSDQAASKRASEEVHTNTKP